MRSKKILSALVAVLSSFTVLTGCSDDGGYYVAAPDRESSDEGDESSERDHSDTHEESSAAMSSSASQAESSVAPAEPQTEAQTHPPTESHRSDRLYAATDLIGQPASEVISLMNGNYDLLYHDTGTACSFYMENQKLFPGMQFFFTGDDFCNECAEAYHSEDKTAVEKQVKSYIESGSVVVDFIIVTGIGKVTDLAYADMTYSEICDALGKNYECCLVGAYGSGSADYIGFNHSASSSVDVKFSFDVPDLVQALNMGTKDIASVKEMEAKNPKPEFAYVRYSAPANENVQTPTQAPTENIQTQTTYPRPVFPYANASSVLPDEKTSQGYFTYSPKNLIDGNTTTAWVEDADGVGKNQYVILTADSPQHVSEITIYNGYCSSKSIYEKNGRITKCKIEFSDGSSTTTSLDTAFGNQPCTVKLANPVDTSYIKITILDACKGSKYDDTCISEIVVK